MKMWSARLRKPIIQSADGCYACAPIGNLRLNTRRANVLLKFLQGHRISIGKYGGYELMHIPPQIAFASDGTTLQFNWNDYEENKGFMPASKAGEILSFLQYAAAALDELKRAMTEVYSTKDNVIHHHHDDGRICYFYDNVSWKSVNISAAQIHADAVNELENTLVWLQRDVNEALGIGLVTRASDNAIDMVQSCFSLTMRRENDPHAACDVFALDAPVTQTVTLEYLMKHLVHACAWLYEEHDKMVRNLKSVHI